MASRLGCSNCTARGGMTRSIDPGNGSTSYEVRQDGVVLDTFRSAVAAATFSRGHIGATVHRAQPADATTA